MLKLETVKAVEASLVMVYVYHLLFVIAFANVTLKPEPEIPVAAEEQVTPDPLEI